LQQVFRGFVNFSASGSHSARLRAADALFARNPGSSAKEVNSLSAFAIAFRYHRAMLRVRLLENGARLPVVAHPGEDLGYDVFGLEVTVLAPRATVRVRTGIAVEARHPQTDAPLGLLVRDRSSMAARGVATTGGVIDAGYRGEILVLMTNLSDGFVELMAGEKIAQMIPVPVLTGSIQEVESLEDSARAAKGFGSSGR
jgi:dUTP pyrophosphatase